MRRNSQQRWTAEETARVEMLLQRKETPSRIAALIGRSYCSTRQKIVRMTTPKSFYYIGSGPVWKDRIVEHVIVPAEVEEDRSRRINEPRTLTMTLFGDPPLSQSALGKRLASGGKTLARSISMHSQGA